MKIKNLKTTICPVCGSQDVAFFLKSPAVHGSKVLDQEKQYQFYKCYRCASVYITNVLVNKQYYKEHYGFEGYQDRKKGIVRTVESYLEQRTYRLREKAIASHFPTNKRISILDIGCGNGGFLSYLNQARYDKSGLELNENEYALAKEKGLNVYNDDIFTKDFKGKKFDVLTLWHVIEHVDDPARLLRTLKTLLADKGIIVFATPNPDCLGFTYGNEHWFHIDTPRHLILLPRKAVRIISEACELAIVQVKCENFEFPLDLFWSVKTAPIRFLLYVFYPIVKLFDQETLTYTLKKL